MRELSGMDIGQVRSMARQMATEAAEIRGLASTLTSVLEQANWVGTDRDRFLDEWRTCHAAAVFRAADSLESGAGNANEFARRQEWASKA